MLGCRSHGKRTGASVNGKPGYRFALTASRAAGGEDRVRVRVWHLAKGSAAEVVDYDNLQAGAAEGAAFGKGAITVQTH